MSGRGRAGRRRHQPLVLITGGAFGNQGAMLMVATVAQQIRERLGGLPVLEIRQGTERQKRFVGADTLLAAARRGLHVPRVRVGTTSVGRRLPFVTSADIDAVFDISGFMYSDQWVGAPLSQFSRALHHWGSRVPLYMLPQAFGPFEQVRAECAPAIAAARRVYARDPQSLEFLLASFPDSADKISIGPDFTPSIRQLRTRLPDPPGNVPVVVNWNVYQRGDGEAYLRDLVTLIDESRARGDTPYALCHETAGDERLIEQLRARRTDLAVVSGLNGLQLRQIIGDADYQVSARFHACVSGLSQAVPTIIFGWSHKYEALAREFGSLEMLAASPLTGERAAELVSLARDPEGGLRGALATAAASIHDANEAMWTELATDLESVGVL